MNLMSLGFNLRIKPEELTLIDAAVLRDSRWGLLPYIRLYHIFTIAFRIAFVFQVDSTLTIPGETAEICRKKVTPPESRLTSEAFFLLAISAAHVLNISVIDLQLGSIKGER